MLNDRIMNECDRLRESFDPRADLDELDAEHHAHLAACAGCTAWTTRLREAIESAASPSAAPQPLPPALGRRLRALGSQPMRCDDVQRLYRAARQSENADPRVREHLTSCPRCATLHAPLRAFFSAPRHPLSVALVRRLRAIARQRRLPLWVRDPRWIAAAGVVLTALSMPLISRFENDAARLATEGRYRGGALLSAVVNESQESFYKLREGQEDVRMTLQQLNEWQKYGIRSLLGSETDEGDNHGRTTAPDHDE